MKYLSTAIELSPGGSKILGIVDIWRCWRNCHYSSNV